MAKKPKKKLLPGEGPLFPGPKYQAKQGVLDLGELKRQVQRLVVELGPDHPKVKMMKKEVGDRQNRASAGQGARK